MTIYLLKLLLKNKVRPQSEKKTTCFWIVNLFERGVDFLKEKYSLVYLLKIKHVAINPMQNIGDHIVIAH